MRVHSDCAGVHVGRAVAGAAGAFLQVPAVAEFLMIMALADRLAEYLDADPNRYLSARAEQVAAGR